jgi:hypothetical protein
MKDTTKIKAFVWACVVAIIFMCVMEASRQMNDTVENGKKIKEIITIGELVYIEPLRSSYYTGDESLVYTKKRVIKIDGIWSGSFGKKLKIKVLNNGIKYLCEGNKCKLILD